MPISIITRAYKTSELRNLITNINLNNEVHKEIIAVCNVSDFNLEGTNLIIENSNRFKAKITGIKNARYENVLFLDSDQIPENGLLSELDKKKENMVIIPEKSINNNFTSKCLDDWRYRIEKLARKQPTSYIPVIPRFYKREVLIGAVNRLPVGILGIITHEDSILYHEAFKETKSIGFSKKIIYNYDPNFSEMMKKAFIYGKNKGEMESMEIPQEIKNLILRLNRNTLNVKELGFGKGYLIQIPRGLSYLLGELLSEKATKSKK